MLCSNHKGQKNLELINAKRRVIYGQETANVPSRFISEIDEKNLDKEKEVTEKLIKEDLIDENQDYTLGEKVEHNVYGIGVIVGIKDKTIDVAFAHKYGIKTFIKGHKVIRKV